MTNLRSLPPGAVITHAGVQLTRDNFGINYQNWPYQDFGTDPNGNSDRLTYGYCGVDFRNGFPSGEPALVSNHWQKCKWIRTPYPLTRSYYNKAQGIHDATKNPVANAWDRMLKMLDFWHQKNCKVKIYLTRNNMDSIITSDGVVRISPEGEDDYKNFVEAMLTNTQTSPLGFTFALHPGLGAIELSNEQSRQKGHPLGSTLNAVVYSTDPIGQFYANAARILNKLLFQYRNNSTILAANSIDKCLVLGVGGSGGVQSDYLAIYGSTSMSWQRTLLSNSATATASNDNITIANHGLAVNDIIWAEQPTVLGGAFNDWRTTNYFLTSTGSNTFTLSLTNGGPAITGGTNGSAECFLPDSSYFMFGTQERATYDATTGVFTLNGHGRTNGTRVALRGSLASEGIAFTHRPYWVVTVVDTNNFRVSANPNSTVLNITADIGSFTVYKAAPVGINGDTDNGTTSSFYDYVDVLTHHYYGRGGTAGTFADIMQNNYRGMQFCRDRHYTACNIPDITYRYFSNRYLAALTVDTVDGWLTFNGPNVFINGRKIILNATTMPSGFTSGVPYFVRDFDSLNKRFKLAATSGGTAIVPTTAGTAVHCVYIPPHYQSQYPFPTWDTESYVAENNDTNANDTTVVTRFLVSLLPENLRREILFRYWLPVIFGTSDGNGGLGVSMPYAAEISAGSNLSGNVLSVAQSGSNRLILNVSQQPRHSVSFSSSFSVQYGPAERIRVTTGDNPIPGVLAANSTAIYTIQAVPGATSVEVNAPYTGGSQTISGITYYLDRRRYGPMIEEWDWLLGLLQNNVCDFGIINNGNTQFPTHFLNVRGVGCWYLKPDGTLAQW